MMDVYINDGDGNAVVAAQDLMVCAKWSCDGPSAPKEAISGFPTPPKSWRRPPTAAHLCALEDTFPEPMARCSKRLSGMCSDAWTGPEIDDWSTNVYEEGDNQLRIESEAGYGTTMMSDVVATDGRQRRRQHDNGARQRSVGR